MRGPWPLRAALLWCLAPGGLGLPGPPPSPSPRAAPVFANGEGGYRAFNIPALVRASSPTLVAFAEARLNGADYDHIDLAQKRSHDGGRTWGRLEILQRMPTGITVHGNPAPVFDDVAQVLLLVWCLNNSYVFVQRSSDDGLTWSPARDITPMVKRPGWGWMATGPSHAAQLRSGRLVVPFNTFFENSEVVTRTIQTGCAHTAECAVYRGPSAKSLSTTVEITNPKDPGMAPLRAQLNGTASVPPFVWAGDRAGVFFSDDHGVSWHLGGMVNSRVGSSECVAAETGQGLLLSFRVEDPDSRCRKMALSRDGGETFGDFFEPSACIPDPVCQGSMVRLRDGRLVTSGPGSRHRRWNLTLFVSAPPPPPPRAGGARARGGAGEHEQPVAFRKLTQVGTGPTGYSDVVELEPDPMSNEASVGVLYSVAGGLAWATARVPADAAAEDLTFEARIV